jgi:hypothetical protein
MPRMTRLVKSLYRSTFCFESCASFAASAVPGSTMPFDLAFTALPGTFLVSGCWERAAASLLERVLLSFWAVARESVSFLFSEVRRALSLERAASSFFNGARSDVRVWSSVICCLSALMTASWSVLAVSHNLQG